jgi:flagellar biosynthesis protein FliQ
MSMGMMMMSPVIVSLPFKVMLFVLVDGWNLVIGSLVSELRLNRIFRHDSLYRRRHSAASPSRSPCWWPRRCLAAASITGLIMSIFQAATQVNEMTLTFVPKLIAMFLTVLVIAGPWMLATLTDYMRRLYSKAFRHHG